MARNKKNKPKYGVVNTHALYVREGVDKDFQPIQSVPIIKEGEKVEILDTIVNENNEEWYHIKMDNDIYGYVKAEFIKK